ncbi:amidohydrolase/deacetylase family metallohydrolase [Companilactobacillus kimchiensis]|uniref:amidohydrolase/deacetylase family metallohydrolase n=1 Tax=Companilactobacillus kimchiensis TaxID=993692 RepID=UPI000A96754F|nr:amidohydrolase/deacetylase family metallohydrolase [Companilactobacillus kimchiensis]
MSSLYIKNGKDINNEPLELLLQDGKILEKATHLENITADTELDLQGKSYITAGWIDDHVHCYEKLSLYYDDPDQVGYGTGVTTVIDAGSTGADNIGDFYQITQSKKTNVYAMINISQTGILDQDELGDMKQIRFKPLQQAVNDYPDFIIGLKARISKSVVVENGIKPLLEAKKFQKQLSQRLPLMVHVGSNPPELKEILSVMEKGDILTHCFNGKENGILNSDDKVEEFVFQAIDDGIIFDIGHGTDSFNFHTAYVALKNQIYPQSLSTDIYHKNREHGPVYDMATCVEKMLYLGLNLKQIIPMITTVPATNYKLRKKGQLKVGMDADVTIFDLKTGEKEIIDSDGYAKVAQKLVKPRFSIIAGKAYAIGE